MKTTAIVGLSVSLTALFTALISNHIHSLDNQDGLQLIRANAGKVVYRLEVCYNPDSEYIFQAGHTGNRAIMIFTDKKLCEKFIESVHSLPHD